MRVVYNAPVTLTFALLSLLVLISINYNPNITLDYFSTPGDFALTSPRFYFTMFSYVLGHSGGNHFRGNMLAILLVGPLLEEKYGSRKLLIMILITAVTTSVLNTLFYHTGVLGASGIVFMMLLIASCVNIRRGQLPITLVLAVVIHLWQEAMQLQSSDNIGHFAHLLGGICGAIFGLLWPPKPGSSADPLSNSNRYAGPIKKLA